MTSTLAPGTVIAAIDGSVDSRRGARWAAEQAHLEHRRLVVIHATSEEAGRTVLGEHRRNSHVFLDEAVALAEEVDRRLPITAVSVPGDPRHALVEVSRTAHLLVLGSRGLGPVRSKLLGSVSAEVAKRAACPVVVTRPTSPGAIKDGVVVGADATAESVPVIEFAFRQASLRQLPLTVMHCVYDAVSAVAGARGPVLDDIDTAELRMLIAESVAGLREQYPDVYVTTRLERGLVEECMVIGPRPWNLIVVGRHPVRAFRTSASTAVLERAHTAVAVVPEATPSRTPR